MALWWLFVGVPLYNLFKALVEAWKLLQEADSDKEREEILERAGAQALLNTLLAILVAFGPFPYNLLGLAPTAFALLGKLIGATVHTSFTYRGRRL